jgi:ABC-2 type transport system permease protein
MLAALIVKELHVLRRDRHGLAAIFLLPAAFIIIMSLALQDVYSPSFDRLSWVVVDAEQSDFSQQLIARWQHAQPKPQVLQADWHAQLQRGELDYAIVIHAGAQASLTQAWRANADAGETEGASSAQPQVALQLAVEPGFDFGLHQALASQLRGLSLELAVGERLSAVIAETPGAVDDFGLETEQIPAAAPTLQNLLTRLQSRVISERLGGDLRPTAVQHNVPAWLIFGMFFVVTSITGLLVEEKNEGTLDRLRAMGVGNGVMLLGKMLPFLAINLLQAGLMLAIGVFVVPLLGGEALSLAHAQWLPLLLVIFSISFAATSLALWVATLVTSQAQAAAVGPAVNVLLAALGGIMVPVFVMPAAMQDIAAVSPMNWALEALLDILVRGAGVSLVVAGIAKLLAFGALCTLLAHITLKVKQT